MKQAKDEGFIVHLDEALSVDRAEKINKKKIVDHGRIIQP